MLANIGRHSAHKLLRRDGLGHMLNVTAHQLHGIASVGAEDTVAILALRRATVNDSNEVICDDDAVLAFLLGVLRDEALFDDFHVRCLYTRRNTGAEPTFPFASWL